MAPCAQPGSARGLALRGRDEPRRDGRRKDRREPRWDAQLDTTTPDPSGGVTTALSVRDAIATLPAAEREAVVLRYLADLPLADVADAMGSAIGTVKATLHQALPSLRVELEEDDDAD